MTGLEPRAITSVAWDDDAYCSFPEEWSGCRDARLRCLLDNWLSLRGGRPIPDRSALDCAAISTLLPYVWICRLEPETGRFALRLAGDEIRWLLRKPVAGACTDDLLPNIAPFWPQPSLLGPPRARRTGQPSRRGRDRP